MKTPRVNSIDVCIYHGNCTDGFGAAWSVFNRFGAAVEYVEGYHSDGESDEEFWLNKVAGKDVACFDFSFSRELTIRMGEVAKSFRVIDHHASALEAVGDLPYCFFNMDKSGAMLAWEACNYDPAPSLIHYVQDQDLWQWQLDLSKEVCTYINAQEKSFESWNKLARALQTANEYERIIDRGHSMLQMRETIARDVATGAEIWLVAGSKVPVVNCPHLLRSFVCDIMGETAQDEPDFVGGYAIKDGKATWSLRSNHGTADVAKVAGTFPGGGGHAKAAGFTIAVERMDFVNRTVK